MNPGPVDTIQLVSVTSISEIPSKEMPEILSKDHTHGTLLENIQVGSPGVNSQYLGTTIAAPPGSSSDSTIVIVPAEGLILGSLENANTVHVPSTSGLKPASNIPLGCRREEAGASVQKSYLEPLALPTE